MPTLRPDLTPLRISRDFRLAFGAEAISGFGSQITYVVVPFQVARLTHSPLAVGLIGVCELAPLLLSALIGGALADYVDRRRLVLAGEIALMALTAGLLLAASHPRLPLLYAAAALAAAVVGLQGPAMDAMLPRLVPPEQIGAASALRSGTGSMGMLVGPGLAGVLIAGSGARAAYAVDLGTFVVSVVLLARLRPVPPPPAAQRPSLGGILTGLRFARSRPELLGTYLVDINAMFFGMPQALFPFVADRLGGPAVLGLVYAAPSAGALLASLTSGWTARIRRQGLAVVLAAGGWGLAIAAFGLAGSLPVALALLALAGGADMISGLFRSIIWNQTVPDHLRGRLAGIEMLSYTSGPTLGNLESGLAAGFLGVAGSIISGGLLCVAGTAMLAGLLPGFVRYDGRLGPQRKLDADAAWAAQAAEAAP